VGNEQENSEKQAKLEQRVDTTFEWFKEALGRIEAKLDASIDRFVSKDIFLEITGSLQKQVNELKTEKKETRRMLPDITMAFSALISLGLTLYLMFHK